MNRPSRRENFVREVCGNGSTCAVVWLLPQREHEAVVSFLCRVAARAPAIVGSPFAFLGALALAVVWLASGWLFDWSEGWVLWPATITSVGAFLLVLLLQYSQNRELRTLQLKLDELIRGLGDARTHLVRLEKLSDEELDQIEEEFRILRERAGIEPASR